MAKGLLHSLIFFISCFCGYAQELVFSNISNELQIPSQECYKILQDKEGYIWFSTDNGLCRYGNGSLKIFDARNGLPEENVYNISQDRNGRLWFATSANRILYFDQGKLKEASFNKAYQKPATKKWSNPIPMVLDMQDPENSYISNYYYAAHIKQSSNTIRFLQRRDSTASLSFLKKKGHPFIPQPNRNMGKFRTIMLSNEHKSQRITLFDLPVANSFHWNTPTAFNGTTDFIGIHNKLLRVNADLSYSFTSFPGRILILYTDKMNGLWVGVENNGVYYFPNSRTMKLGHHSLSGFSVTGIAEDKEQGIWCTTLEKGVFYSRNKNLISYSSTEGLDKNMTLLKYINGKLVASSSGKTIFRWTNQQLEIADLGLKDIRFSDILQFNSHFIFAGKEMMVRTDLRLKSKEPLLQLPYYVQGAKELTMGDDDQIYGVLGKNIIGIHPNSTNIVSIIALTEMYVSHTIVHKGGPILLLGGDQGLYEFNVITRKSRKIKGIPEKIRKIIKTRSGKIWIATKNNGIFWLEGEKVTDANHILKLKALLFYDLTEDAYGTIWAGSNQGLYRFSVQDNTYQATNYSTSHGLPSNEVYKVAADRKKIWFSTFEGLLNLPLSGNSLNKTGPQIHLQKFSVNGQTSENIPKSLHFQHNRNNFRFTFDILTFKNGTNTQLEYHLIHNGDSMVTKLDGADVFLENLDPGSYQLIVYGINNDGIKSPHPERFFMTIEPPFWQTWWFLVLTSFLFLTTVFLVVRLIIRSIRKKEEAKTKVNKLMAEYQITALQAQMNPHFIFNAINTIQGYILEKSEEEAYNYLAKFGKLIRAVLHHSQEKTVLLKHELEVLNLYIDLEQLRFDHCFDYTLTLSEKVFPEQIYLPGMILQPYVENAIWHGMVNLRESRQGKLEITIDQKNDLLVVTIRDNGIGREMAMSFNKDRRHKSVGMQLTAERLNAMSQLHGYETASVTITDLYDENGAPAGTSVDIRIPINTET